MPYSTLFRYIVRPCTVLLALCCTCGPALYGQEFAPVGAQWTYFHYVTPGNDYSVATVFTVPKDTLIDGWSCRIIQETSILGSGEQRTGEREVVYATGDSVYVYLRDSFHLVFDYTARAGDTVRVVSEPFKGLFFPPSRIQYSDFAYRVDSVTRRVVGEDTLRLQYVSYLRDVEFVIDQWGFQNIYDLEDGVPGQILEGVGGLGTESMLGTTNGIGYIPEFGPGRLSCYRDTVRDYRLQGIDCDSLLEVYQLRSSVVASATPQTVRLFPNPFREQVSLEFAGRVRRLEVRDAAGRLVHTQVGGSTQGIVLGALAPGLYYFTVTDGAGRRWVARGVRIR
ncbi:hypothetical protein LEM8419_00120 [Neolewinella maritima]|uniref:T9SS type A sorting domain-containing protein n=1 Tax=Neolewinella maritima TaxID=1383882 RepID=A0ABN8EZR3_9BACT|nr:T9SS type A sorting domain-containing protein [Neolewinella maritima]CAH0998780.1 hypothetical protein LEM8419_00120 [Neolewinella maritima]